jgi:hypothetical protein
MGPNVQIREYVLEVATVHAINCPKKHVTTLILVLNKLSYLSCKGACFCVHLATH